MMSPACASETSCRDLGLLGLARTLLDRTDLAISACCHVLRLQDRPGPPGILHTRPLPRHLPGECGVCRRCTSDIAHLSPAEGWLPESGHAPSYGVWQRFETNWAISP